MKFTCYSESELLEAGLGFVGLISRRNARFVRLGTEAWTEFVLDWWATTAAEGMLVDARRARERERRDQTGAKVETRRCFGEFMLDMVHSTYPAYDTGYLTKAYWDCALKSPLHVKLALESEWGHELDGDLSLARVLEDAAKIASVRASAKVMIFASSSENNPRERVLDMLSRIRSQSGDTTPWLWLDVPWDLPLDQSGSGLVT